MTQEEKQLLLKDLCARLPYGVRMNVIRSNVTEIATYINSLNEEIWVNDAGAYIDIEEVRPYLRPMSSMTGKEKQSYYKLMDNLHFAEGSFYSPDIKDWLDERFFDYRGLIEKGLALEAPEDMYIITL